jgi:hypothetical protein
MTPLGLFNFLFAQWFFVRLVESLRQMAGNLGGHGWPSSGR